MDAFVNKMELQLLCKPANTGLKCWLILTSMNAQVHHEHNIINRITEDTITVHEHLLVPKYDSLKHHNCGNSTRLAHVHIYEL